MTSHELAYLADIIHGERTETPNGIPASQNAGRRRWLGWRLRNWPGRPSVVLAGMRNQRRNKTGEAVNRVMAEAAARYEGEQ